MRFPTTVIVVILGLFTTTAAVGQPDTLARVQETGKLRIGFVPDAPPLSFLDDNDKPAGYSIQLCAHIASAVSKRLDMPDLELEYVPLTTMEQRLDAVESGEVDIECGATTVTLSRRERVDFTLMTFITGTAVLSRRGSAIEDVDDLAGAKIAVLPDTTTEEVMRRVIEVNGFDVELVEIDSNDDGMQLLNAGKVDGYATDRAMLIGHILQAANANNRYALTRTALSFEPYALMVPRGDTEFRLLADRALASLFRSARIRRLYHEWFGRFGEPLSPIVEAMYQFQAVDE